MQQCSEWMFKMSSASVAAFLLGYGVYLVSWTEAGVFDHDFDG